MVAAFLKVDILDLKNDLSVKGRAIFAIINGITIENSNEGIKDILYGVKYGKNSK